MSDKISIEDFLREEKSLIKLTELEIRLGMPHRTLQRVIEGRNVPKKFRQQLIDLLTKLGSNISNI